MQSPNNPTYVDTRIYPVMDVRDLRREATLENVAAHQRCLEKLQFEMSTLRSWSNSIQDQIIGEAHQVHLHLMRIIQEIQRQSAPEPWAHGWSSGPSQLPPRPVQPTAQPSNVLVKPAPAPRPQPQQASSSGMSSAPTNAPFREFPPQMSADPCAQNSQNQQ